MALLSVEGVILSKEKRIQFPSMVRWKQCVLSIQAHIKSVTRGYDNGSIECRYCPLFFSVETNN